LVIFLTRMMNDKIFPSIRNKEADSEVIGSAHKCTYSIYIVLLVFKYSNHLQLLPRT